MFVIWKLESLDMQSQGCQQAMDEAECQQAMYEAEKDYKKLRVFFSIFLISFVILKRTVLIYSQIDQYRNNLRHGGMVSFPLFFFFIKLRLHFHSSSSHFFLHRFFP
jgi:hypothetical protein